MKVLDVVHLGFHFRSEIHFYWLPASIILLVFAFLFALVKRSPIFHSMMIAFYASLSIAAIIYYMQGRETELFGFVSIWFNLGIMVLNIGVNIFSN